MLKTIFDHLEEILGALVMAVMVTLAFVNVITRYVIVYPLAFTEEITISMFVWVTLLGISIAFRKNAHLAVTFFNDLMPESVRKLFFFIANGMALALFALLAWLGFHQVMDEWELGAITDSLAIPSCVYSAGIPVFSVLIIIRITQFMVRTTREGRF